VSKKIAVVFGWAVILAVWSSSFAAESPKTIRVLYDNYVFDQDCCSDWGFGREVFMVLGGTHLLNHSDVDLQRVVDDLKGLGVQKVGATHCSGDKAIAKMKEPFGDGFVTMGVGRVIQVGE
jgi:hypothetical protein